MGVRSWFSVRVEHANWPLRSSEIHWPAGQLVVEASTLSLPRHHIVIMVNNIIYSELKTKIVASTLFLFPVFPVARFARS